MSEIQVITTDLRSSSQSLDGAGKELVGVKSQVSGIPGSVGNAYDGQLQRALQGILGGAAQTAAQLQSRSINLGDELLSRATGFEAANEAAKGSVLGASSNYVNFIETSKGLGFLSFLSRLKEKAQSIWSIGGLAISGFVSSLFFVAKPGVLTPFPETAPPTHFPETSQSPSTGEKSELGKLMDKFEQEKLEKAKLLDRSKVVDISEKFKGGYQEGRNTKIDAIVMHGTGGSTASGAITALENRHLSSHYVIDKDGTIYQLVKDEDAAYHATWYNNRSIGIEVVQSKLDKPIGDTFYEQYTQEQLDSAKKLVLDLSQKYNISSKSILSHQMVDKMAKEAGMPKNNYSGKVDGNEHLSELRQFVDSNK